jgi:CheY-like chemotaxis protein
MSPTLFLLVALVALVFLALAGGLLWFWRQRSVKSKVAKKKPVKDQIEKRLAPGDNPQPVQLASSPAPATAAKKPTSASASANSRNEGNEEQKIRILIVDDNTDTRENVGRLLYFEKDMEVIGQAVNGREGIAMAIKHKPHIVLMDINMEPMNGIEAAQIISKSCPNTKIIGMSVHADMAYVNKMLEVGAVGYVTKNSSIEEMVKAIKHVTTGRKYVCIEIRELFKSI